MARPGGIGIGPQRGVRADAQRAEELIAQDERRRRAGQHGPHLGAATASFDETVGGFTGTIMSLLTGYTRPFECKHLSLRMRSQSGGVEAIYRAGIYRCPKKELLVGSMKLSLAAKTEPISTTAASVANVLAELDRRVNITADGDLWFAALSKETGSSATPGTSLESSSAKTGTFQSTTLTDMPAVLDYPGQVSRTTSPPYILALSRTGKRLLWD
jgi:hypothetical protein